MGALRFTSNVVSFPADDLVLTRYCELDGRPVRVLAVATLRGSQHGKPFRRCEVTRSGIQAGEGLQGHTGSVGGAPVPFPASACAHRGPRAPVVRIGRSGTGGSRCAVEGSATGDHLHGPPVHERGEPHSQDLPTCHARSGTLPAWRISSGRRADRYGRVT